MVFVPPFASRITFPHTRPPLDPTPSNSYTFFSSKKQQQQQQQQQHLSGMFPIAEIAERATLKAHGFICAQTPKRILTSDIDIEVRITCRLIAELSIYSNQVTSEYELSTTLKQLLVENTSENVFWQRMQGERRPLPYFVWNGQMG
ncbi:hypothetical protein GQ53DRAFT_129625 [Thozetella sp. PMI_491]|nr:hypothetical protein GQ53DRAFT_129625 [Thozetella sp. PMI_491]